MKRLLPGISIFLFLFFAVSHLFAQTDQTVSSGDNTTAVNFPGTGCVYNWTNDNPSIGLAASGSGTIASFKAVNNGSSAVKANITATPVAPDVAYIPIQSTNSVAVISTLTNTVIANIPVGLAPSGVAISGDGSRVYITNQTSGTVSVISTATNSVLATINVGAVPYGISITPDGSLVYVTHIYSNSVSVINTASNSVISTISVGKFPFDAVASPDGKQIYVPNEGSNTVSVISVASNTVIATIPVGTSPVEVSVSEDGKKLYVANSLSNNISIIETSDNKVVATIAVGKTPEDLSVSPDGSVVYVANSESNTLTVINASTNSIASTINVGINPSYLSLSIDGTKLYLITEYDQSVSIINTSNFVVLDKIRLGQYPSGLGNFITGGKGCNGLPVNFSITVDVAVQPVVTAGILTGNISACTGTASTSPDIQQFTVTGHDLTSDIAVIAPTNFEVSLSATGNYTNALTIPQSNNAASAMVYIRASATALPGNITGSVLLTATGAVSQNVAVTGVINPLPTVDPVGNQILTSGFATSAVTFTGTAGVINWSNDTPGIGLPASGTGDITSFPTINTSLNPITATVTATPQSTGTGCTGTPIQFTITVNPPPTIIATSALSALTTVYGTPSSAVSLNVSGVSLTTGILVTPPPGFEVSTDDMNFSNTVIIGAAGPVTATSVYLRITATASVGTYSGNIVLTSAGAPAVNVPTVESKVMPAPLIITASNAGKFFGTLLTNTSGSIYYTTSGLQNSDQVNSVDVSYGNGAVANAAPGTYPGSVTITNATGNPFDPNNYVITYVPGDIDVYDVPVTGITIAGDLSPLTTVYGTPSSSISFTVSATNLTAGILITPPAGFEVSADNNTFSGTVVVGTSGTLSPTLVYIRIAATSVVGKYSGNVVLTSPGVTAGILVMPVSTVTPALLTISADAQIKTYGTPNPLLTVTYSGFENSDGPAQLTYQPLVNTTATLTSPYGQYLITASGAASPNYTFIYIPGYLSVVPSSQAIVIPNAFTPNGDGINDVWNIKYLDYYPDCTVNIFTRYGEHIYQSISYPVPWDGRFKGAELPTGVYYYIINLKNGSGLLSGNVTIIR